MWHICTNTTYIPLSATTFATGVVAGATANGGYLTVTKNTLSDGDYNTPYGLSFEYQGGDEYEGRYSSFLATSVGGGHFGYVVSTWNDGITGWNF